MGVDEKFKIGEEIKVYLGRFYEPKWVTGYISDVTEDDDYYIVRYRAEDGTATEARIHKAFMKRVFHYSFVEKDSIDKDLLKLAATIYKNDSIDLKISILENIIKEKSTIGLKSIEKNGDTLTFLWEHGEPIVLTKAKGDKEDLATAFVYAFFMHAMGWTKAKAHKFLDSLETSQDKRKRLNEEKAKKAQEEKAQKEKEYKKKIKRIAKKQLRKRKFWDDVEKEVNKIEKK